MKRVILYSFIFIAVLVLSTLVFFPYTKVAQSAIDDAIAKSGENITYATIDAGLFSLKLDGVEYRSPKLKTAFFGDIKVSYTPLIIFTKKANVSLKSPFANIDSKVSASSFTAKGSVNTRNLGKLVGNDIDDNTLNIDLEYLSDGSGYMKLSGTDVKISKPMSVSIKTVDAEGKITNNVLNIDRFNLTGDVSGSLTGQVRINPQALMQSDLNINGDLSIMGMKSRFTIGGRIMKPAIRF